MKSLLSESVCAGVFGLILATATHAETIVDTGPGPQTFVGYAIDENISQAVEFSINHSYTITNVQFWMFPGDTDADFRFTLYTDGGEVPGSQLFVASTSLPGSTEADWHGVSGLNWAVDPGSYWVSVETDNGMASAPFPASNPLANYAYLERLGEPPFWVEDDSLSIGVRIEAVPIPSALWLFGSGMLGLIGISGRKNAVLQITTWYPKTFGSPDWRELEADNSFAIFAASILAGCIVIPFPMLQVEI